MSDKKTPDDVHKMFVADNNRSMEDFVFNNAHFQHLTIKEAKELATTLSNRKMSFAMTYHQSMSVIEREQ